jgi:hypothetical protein
MNPPSMLCILGSVVLVACSSSPPPDGRASTTPSEAPAEAKAPDSTAATPSATAPSATAPSATAALPAPNVIQTAEYHGVVLTVKSPSASGVTTFGNATLDGVWTPTAADVTAFESGLGAFMTKSVPADKKQLPIKMKSYKRQWIGVSAGNKKLIFGNFLCREMTDWQKGVIMVDDGGDCYFQLFYDVASGRYEGLMINGNA